MCFYHNSNPTHRVAINSVLSLSNSLVAHLHAGSLATKYPLVLENPIFAKYANITYYNINISWQICANNLTYNSQRYVLSFGKIINIRDGLHIRLASALLKPISYNSSPIYILILFPGGTKCDTQNIFTDF